MSDYARGGGSSGAIEGPVGAGSGAEIARACTPVKTSIKQGAGATTATAQAAIEVQEPVDQGFPHVDVSPSVSQPSVATGANAGAGKAADSEALVTACCMPWCMEPVITEALIACAPRIPQSVPPPNSESCKSNTLESAARRRWEKARGRMLEFRKRGVRIQFSAKRRARSGEIQRCCVGKWPGSLGRIAALRLCRYVRWSRWH